MSIALAFGLLVSAQATVNLTPMPPRLRAGTISNADYPPAARAQRAEGVTRMALHIGSDGRERDCGIERTSGHSELDSVSCRLAQQRFRFQPATRNGEPVASTYRMSVRWRLPAATPTAADAAPSPEG